MTRAILGLAALITALAMAIGFLKYGLDPLILAPGPIVNPTEWATRSGTIASIADVTTEEVREAVIRSIVPSEPPIGGGFGTPRLE